MKTKLTKKEQRLVMLMVKRASQDEINNQIEGILENDNYDNIVYQMAAFLGEKIPEEYQIQYLNYCSQYYDKIVSRDFSEEMERVIEYELTQEATESEIVYVNYEVRFKALPSFLDKEKDKVESNFWDYNPERSTIDYGDSDTLESTFQEPTEIRRGKIFELN